MDQKTNGPEFGLLIHGPNRKSGRSLGSNPKFVTVKVDRHKYFYSDLDQWTKGPNFLRKFLRKEFSMKFCLPRERLCVADRTNHTIIVMKC